MTAEILEDAVNESGHFVKPTQMLPLYRPSSGKWWILQIRGADHIPDYSKTVLEPLKGTMPEPIYATEVLGQWNRTSGRLVYPEFGEDRKSTRLNSSH